MSSICVEGLSHSFGDKKVLNNISFRVEKGQIFGLLGPSGAGKTTLINILTGQVAGKNGDSKDRCEVLGKSSHSLTGEDYQKIGIMMDHLGLYERMSCYDNLKFYQMLDGVCGSRRRRKPDNKNLRTVTKQAESQKIEQVLTQVGLLEAKKTAVMNLSKGMKNRLAFARAIMKGPQLLFLDEPTGGLDPATLEAIHKMILEERNRGTTIFLTTHNMHEAEKLCDKIALLNEGCIVEYGAPVEICRRYNHRKRIHVHLTNGVDWELPHEEAAGKVLQEYFERGEVETIHSTEPNLETIFMELTGRKLEV